MIRKLTAHTIHVNELCDIAKGPALPNPKAKGMFGNCFFPLFFVFKNKFLFLRLKNLFGNSKLAENKNCFQNSICEGN